MSARVDLSRPAMGTTIRVIVEGPDEAVLHAAAERAFAVVDRYERTLTRFIAGSELSRLNSDPRPVVPATSVMRAFIVAARAAGLLTGGLVDATLLEPLERAGYDASRDGWPGGVLEEALAAAPVRRPARPAPAALWRTLAAPLETGVVARPVGVRIDSGGIGKGLAADAALAAIGRGLTAVVDCGGDVTVRGHQEIAVADPFTGELVHAFRLAGGAIATSGIDRRLWRRPDGSYAHHLIDPSTGEPAWTGVVSATAVAPTAAEAEALAKAAVLSGPAAAAQLLARHGWIVFDESRTPSLRAAA
jgi:thiamine biosynthesis lipoprotein